MNPYLALDPPELERASTLFKCVLYSLDDMWESENEFGDPEEYEEDQFEDSVNNVISMLSAAYKDRHAFKSIVQRIRCAVHSELEGIVKEELANINDAIEAAKERAALNHNIFQD